VARKNSYYDKLIFMFKNAPAFTPLVMVTFGFLVRAGVADDRYYASDFLLLTITATYTITSAITFWYIERFKASTAFHVATTTIFHVLTIAYIVFVSGFLNVFIAIWIPLMISAELRFKMRGFLASFAALFVAGGLMLVLYDMPQSEQLAILQAMLIIGAISFAIARIHSITDRERERLAKSREQEIYQREQLMALINSMGDAVVATDENGIIKVYNSTLLNLLDTNLNLTGKSIGKVLNIKDSNQQPVNLIDEVRSRKSVFSRSDVGHYFEDGDVVKLYINVAPIQPGYRSRAERGFIFILRDITKEKTLEEERDEFVSVVSHELRTPVTIAEGNLSNIRLMFDHKADATMIRSAVDDAHDHIVYLAKLVNDLATLARAERGTAGAPETVDLSTMLQDLYTTYLPQAEAKKLKMNLDIAPKLGDVTTNKLYLQEIMQNLITNSLKYTREGAVTLRGTRTKDFIAVSVADTGIGISMSDQKRIFQKFYRSEDYRTRESSGTGLGLYVCRKLAEKIGLRIEVVSRLNHGSTFTVIIPADSADSPAQPAAATPAPDNTHSDPSS
jgi:two-component system, OmpR family, phosphate regulon sensor histidine kinase PhoR